MKKSPDYSDNEEYKLSYDLLKRYLSLSCTLNEALVLTKRTLDGEVVCIKTGIKEGDTLEDEDNSLESTTDFLLDFLLDDEDDFLFDDEDFC